MKKWFKKKSNILFLVVLTFLIFQQLPVIRNNQSHKYERIKPMNLTVLSPKENGTLLFPPKDSRALAIFWASWCVPCKIEMNRLKKSVESGAIPENAIFAINPFESGAEVRKFILENNYPFIFLEASTLPKELGVRVTPTTLFIEKGTITKMSSGMSIWGIWQAELFL